MQGQMDLHQKKKSLGMFGLVQVYFQIYDFCKQWKSEFWLWGCTQLKNPGEFLIWWRSSWPCIKLENPWDFFHLVPETKYRFRASKKYTQAGATKRSTPKQEQHKKSTPKQEQKHTDSEQHKVRFLIKLTILVRMLTLFWTGPQIHEDPKENQLTIGRSTHRAIYTHMWRRVRGRARARAPPHVCVDRPMGRSPDG